MAMTSTIDSAPETAVQAEWRNYFEPTEYAELTRMRDWRSWFTVALNWGIIGFAFFIVAEWPNVLTVLVALFLIGARQLGLAVIMHDAAHYAFMRNRKLNDWVGNWLGAYAIWGDLLPYRPYHLQHHAHTWSKKDPDLALAKPFPTTRSSLYRKIFRDLSGQTGWKRARATLMRDLGWSQGKVQHKGVAGLAKLKGVLVTNSALFAILALSGHPELYLLWVVAWLTTYSLVMRIRAIGEHSMITDPCDPFKNTRTTRANWLERLFIAPNRVNYHLEHHLSMRVPHYNLPRMHAMLGERGALAGALVENGYTEVLRQAAAG
jgi:fatty acid desaturase